jgi:hypothetical protein
MHAKGTKRVNRVAKSSFEVLGVPGNVFRGKCGNLEKSQPCKHRYARCATEVGMRICTLLVRAMKATAAIHTPSEDAEYRRISWRSN